MKIILSVLTIFLVLMITSCQREISFEIRNNTNDSTSQVTSVLRIVEYDHTSPEDDSITRIVKSITSGNDKKVVIAEIYSEDLLDTAFTTYSYDTQGRLSGIKMIYSSDPNTTQVNCQFTWNINRLVRVNCDTFGVFSDAVDLSYAPDGSNTAITAVYTPTKDYPVLDGFHKVRYRLTVNNQFIPVNDEWISHTYLTQGGLPESSRDTVTGYYIFSGTNLASYKWHQRGYDTTGPGGSNVSIHKDTTDFVYNRDASGMNIADTLRKIYGNDLYTLMNFNLIDLPFPFIYSEHENDAHLYTNPLTSRVSSRKVWVNGIFDAVESYTNYVFEKATNTFDVQGRLTSTSYFWSGSSTSPKYVVKVYYQ
jgi:hypothetical protein